MEVLTHSKRQLFKTCPRAYYYRHELRLVPRVEKAPLRRGTAFGIALQVAHESEEQDIGRLEAAMRAADAYYDQQQPNSQQEQDELDWEREVTLTLAFRYLEVYGLAGRREVEFSRALVNPDTRRASRSFVLGGKIDGLIVTKPGHAVIIEDKLTQQINQAKIQSLPLDEQTTEYLDALLWKGWTGLVEYRHTRWPSIKQRQTETLPEFMARFKQDVDDRPDFYFVSERLHFPTDQIEDHRRERWQIAKAILHARRTQTWWKNPRGCDPFSGGCQYLPLCTCRPDAMDLYRVAEDNPELSVG